MSEDENNAAAEPEGDLKRRRGALKGVLTRIKNKIDLGLAGASLQMLKLLEEQAITTFRKYEIITLEVGDDEDPSATESCYYECVAALRTLISFKEGLAKSAEVTTGSKPTVSKLKLPDIQLQPFDGKYMEYKPFIEMFNALVHNDTSIDSIQKFFYLRNFLKGEAYDLIKNLPVIGSSYSEALTILVQCYDNKHKIVHEHISGLFDLPCMSKCNVSALRSLISMTKQHLAALKNLGESVDKWDSILVCLLTRKLDPLTGRAYHLERDSSVQPTYTDLIKFLEDRALALENSETKDIGYASSKSPAPAKVANVVVKEVKCLFCSAAAPA